MAIYKFLNEVISNSFQLLHFSNTANWCSLPSFCYLLIKNQVMSIFGINTSICMESGDLCDAIIVLALFAGPGHSSMGRNCMEI